jgi:outer membrane protein
MKKMLSLSLLLAAALPATAADLVSVYRDALAYDAQFAAARAALDAGRERLPQGRAGLLPTVGLGVSTTWNETDTTLRSPGAPTNTLNYNTNGWNVQLTQPLFRWQNWVGYNQAELSVALAESQYEATQMDLIVRSAQAYFDVLLAQEVLVTAQALKTANAEQLEAAKRNFEVGTTTVTDTHEAQARYDLAVAQEIAASNDLMVKRHALQSLIGKDPQGLRPLRRGVQLQMPAPNDMTAWIESAEKASPSIRAAQVGLEIASREVERQYAGHLPTLDLVASSGRANQSAGATGLAGSPGVERETSTIGLQLTVPLFAGGYTQSKAREAVALKEKASADYDNARRSVAQGVRQAFLGVTSGLAQVKAYEAAQASTQSALESTKLGYEVGVRINIEVLNAQAQVYDTQQKLAKARLDTVLAQLRLKAVAGSLTDQDLTAANALLD